MKKLLKNLNLTEAQIEKIVLRNKRKKPKVLKQHMTDEIIKFGVVSDTHLCSTHEHIDALHTFYNICKKSDIKIVLNAGDIVSGWRIYRGQENEVHTYGVQNQANYVAENYPKVRGIKTYFITGNHDESWFKLAGIDIGELIGKLRRDMIYLGMYNANVTLGKVRIQLHHGDGGGAYALSYKGQKFAEQMPSGKKPRVLILGHYHTAFYFWYRNMHILNAGCFERQSLFLKRKMLNPAIGGWIIEMRVSKKANDVLAFNPCWVPFF